MDMDMDMDIKSLVKGIGISQILDHHCHVCGVPTINPICSACENDLLLNKNGCHVCDLPLTTENTICGECQAQMPSFDKVLCAYRYEGTLPHLIHQLKEKQAYQWADHLSSMLVRRILQEYECTEFPNAILPVPIHWRRFFSRGYNQSQLIAVSISKQLKIPTIKCVHKRRFNKPQQFLNRRERHKNLAGSFSVTKDLSNMHLAIVDDVVTTGATAEVIAKLLKKEGAKKVDVWALARTPKL